jgi:hypothetical protein
MTDNIFTDDWRDCLRAHYSHVVRTEDHVTEPSLHKVMNAAGFSESELAEMRVRATMRADEMPGGFEPDLDILADASADSTPEAPFMIAMPEMRTAEAEQAAILEETPADEAEILAGEEEAITDEAEPFAVEEEAPVDEPALADDGTFYEADDDEDAPQQLSLF